MARKRFVPNAGARNDRCPTCDDTGSTRSGRPCMRCTGRNGGPGRIVPGRERGHRYGKRR
jgi:hypothetical protein